MRLDNIADLLSEMEFASDKDAERLLEMMEGFKTTYHHSFNGLMKIPGFKKLWDALNEAARYTVREMAQL